MARTPTPVTEPDCALLMLPSSSIAAVLVFRSTYTSANSAPRDMAAESSRSTSGSGRSGERVDALRLRGMGLHG